MRVMLVNLMSKKQMSALLNNNSISLCLPVSGFQNAGWILL